MGLAGRTQAWRWSSYRATETGASNVNVPVQEKLIWTKECSSRFIVTQFAALSLPARKCMICDGAYRVTTGGRVDK